MLKQNNTKSSSNLTGNKQFFLAWIILVLSLVITFLFTINTKNEVDTDSKKDFEFVCNEVREKIIVRMSVHEQILRSGAAFIEHSENVNRQEWHDFIEYQNIDQKLPGIQGVGFTLLIQPQEIEKHIKKIRNEGFPGYNIRPNGKREIYSSIVYLEPFINRNLRAFGYDMLSEPIRRIAMERSRDENAVALSGKVILVQENNKNIQAGTLMYMPVYRSGIPHDTVIQRQSAIIGWVYSPFRMNDLMRGILGGWDLANDKRIHLKIFDGNTASANNLLYDSQPDYDIKTETTKPFYFQSQLFLAGHQWTIIFAKSNNPALGIGNSKVIFVLFGGLFISLLLFALTYSLLNTRMQALQIANELTTELRESEEKYRVIFNNEIYAICIFDLKTLTILDVNEAYTNLYGYSREELLSGMTIHDITAEQQVSEEATNKAIREGTIFIPLRYHRKKDGTVFPVEIVGGPYLWQGKNVMFALAHDITVRKQIEDELIKSKEQYDNLVSNIPIGVYTMRSTPEGQSSFEYVSCKIAEIFEESVEKFLENSATGFKSIHPDDIKELIELNQTLFKQPEKFLWEGRAIINDNLKWLKISSSPELLNNGDILWHGIVLDITERKKAEEELKAAFNDIKTLRGIVPICAHCKNIRDDKGYWKQVEVYVRDHTEAEFSHSICPECMKEVFSEYDISDDEIS